MQPSRRTWQVVAVALLLAALAVVVAQPVLLLGSAALAALLLARQWVFLADCDAAVDWLAVDLDVAREYVRQGETTAVTLKATLAEPTPVDLTAHVETPLQASADGALTVTIPADEQRATTTVAVTYDVAGTAQFGQPTVTFSAADGLFSETTTLPPTASVVVEPRAPGGIHVGEGGQRLDVAFGEHRAGQFGQGIEPAEIRQYVPGDDVTDIDWKASARQRDIYVREYEVETDRQTVLLFDHGRSLARGPEGESMVTYLREVALAYTHAAEGFDDPLGLYTVGDDGLTAEFAPAADTDQYREIRRALHDLEPTSGRRRGSQLADPAGAGRKAAVMAGERSTFATTLRSYFENTREYVQRIEGKPLFEVARTYLDRIRGDTRTVIFTDDSDRATLRETVKVARGGAGTVTVLLAPGALFEEGVLADPERIYEEYVAFESFRRELAGIDRVDAFEVAPEARLEAILAESRARQ